MRLPPTRDRRGSGGTDATAALIDRMARTIVDEVDPERVILFGSRARGDATENSDVDFLVVETEPFGADRCRLTEEASLYQALAGFDIDVDVLVRGRDEVDYWRDSLNNVVGRALREGRTLYERPQASP